MFFISLFLEFKPLKDKRFANLWHTHQLFRETLRPATLKSLLERPFHNLCYSKHAFGERSVVLCKSSKECHESALRNTIMCFYVEKVMNQIGNRIQMMRSSSIEMRALVHSWWVGTKYRSIHFLHPFIFSTLVLQ